MCTVLFLPTESGCIISSNRDEDPKRQASLPKISTTNSGRIIFPSVDFAANSWIGIHENNTILVLLNGAFENHERKSFYKKSRGVMLIEMLSSSDVLNYWELVDLEFIEPFTMVLHIQNELWELVWDQQIKHTKRLDTSLPHIWSSSTLYNTEHKDTRNKWFETWLKTNPKFEKNSVLDFLIKHDENYFGFNMQRYPNLRTLSISIIEKSNESICFNYHEMNELKQITQTNRLAF